MKRSQIFSGALILTASIAALAACQKQEGPMERACKDLDKAIDSVGQQVEKAGDSIQDAAKDAKK